MNLKELKAREDEVIARLAKKLPTIQLSIFQMLIFVCPVFFFLLADFYLRLLGQNDIGLTMLIAALVSILAALVYYALILTGEKPRE
jgi:ABC-type siderophore export system fused ATPase/permease subunit